MTDQPQTSQNAAIDKERLRQKYLEERDKRLRPDGNDQYLRVAGQLAHYLDDPYTPRHRARAEDRPRHRRLHRRRLRRARHRRAAEGGRHRRRPHHREGRRLRRHLVLEPLPGRAVRHGVDSSTCRCSKRPATCRPRSTRTRRRSSSTASASASSTASTTTRCSTPRSTTSSGTRHNRAGSSAPTAATSSPRSSSAWAPGRCTCRSCPASPASSPSRATRSTPAAGTTTTPAATRRARRWTSWPTSASASSAPAPRPCSACRTSRAACKELYVFQRTPSSVDVRDNAPTDPEWFAEIATPGWQQRWLENFTANQTGGSADEDLVQDGWTDLSRRIRAKIMDAAAERAAPRRRCWRRSRTPTSRRWRRSAPGSTRSSGPRDGRRT